MMPTRSKSPKKHPARAKQKSTARSPKAATRKPDLRNLADVVRLQRIQDLPNPRNLFGKKGVEAIRQNAILARIQLFWNQLNRAQKAAKLLELMQLRELQGQAQITAFVQMGIRDKTLVGAADEKHAQDDWLGRYFTGPVARIFIEGMIVAGQRSLASRQPLAIYWVAGAGRSVKVAVAESPRQVTFLLMTPPSPRVHTDVRRLARPEPLWVVSPQGKNVIVEQVFPNALV